jgi:hypothetical protein
MLMYYSISFLFSYVPSFVSCLICVLAVMTPIRTVSEGVTFKCIPSDYTKTEYGF